MGNVEKNKKGKYKWNIMRFSSFSWEYDTSLRKCDSFRSRLDSRSYANKNARPLARFAKTSKGKAAPRQVACFVLSYPNRRKSRAKATATEQDESKRD